MKEPNDFEWYKLFCKSLNIPENKAESLIFYYKVLKYIKNYSKNENINENKS